ncbi:sulfotransferase family protein [Haliea sp. E17]|uniref:sulfotransferase family protein n=1 Tax=Haliea sp. E17 TaxID=3401576 RepID=UPI003AAAE471
MAHKLVAEELIARARAATGLENFDSDSFREGLDVYLDDANLIPPDGFQVERFAGSIVQALATRLKVTDYLAKRPELLQRPVEKPVFVFGIPRTGTTLLSNLLAADPARRSPLTWEIDDPVPPPTSATLYSDPRALGRLEAERKMLEANPEMGKYYRGSAIYPNECMFFVMHDFKALIWESRGKLPNYRDWLFNEADMTSTYEYHKRYLQLLQADAPGNWNLKMPSHALWLDTLLKVYPDARLVWTHRDPLTAVGSFCSIISLGHRGFNRDVDLEYIGQDCLWQAQQHCDRILDARETLGERIVDVHYAQLTDEPIATMRQLYAALGDEFTAEAEAGMQSWLDDNPPAKFGEHEYKLGQFGLSPDTVRPHFERYLSTYDIAMEG